MHGFDRGGRRRDGVRIVGVAIGIDDAQTVIVRRLHRTLLDFEREGIAGRRDRDRARRRAALDRVLDDAHEIFARRREHPERVAIALIEDPFRRAAAVDHRHRVTLGNGRGRERGPGGVGSEDEVNLVVGDQTLYELRRRLRVRLIVRVMDRDGVALRSDPQAAVCVDVAHPEVVALFGEQAFLLQRTAERNRRPEDDGALRSGGGRGDREGERGEREDRVCSAHARILSSGRIHPARRSTVRSRSAHSGRARPQRARAPARRSLPLRRPRADNAGRRSTSRSEPVPRRA